MSKTKMKFNIMDAVILVAVLIAIAILLYIFVFSETTSVGSMDSSSYSLTYVVEVVGLEEEFADRIAPGTAVIDSSKKMHIGTVTSVEKMPYLYMGTNVSEGTLVLNPVDDYSNLYITIEADATLDGISYSIGGYKVYVGSLVYMSFSDIVCSGYCISLDAAQ